MEINKAGVKDITIISDLASRIWYDAYSAILSKEQIAYMLDLFYSHKALEAQFETNHIFLLLSNYGQHIGFASFEPDYADSISKLHKLYVLPQQQGSGGGRRLVAEIERLASEYGNRQVTLNVNRYNKAIDFYLKNGYKVTGREDIEIGNGYLMEDYIMMKAI